MVVGVLLFLFSATGGDAVVGLGLWFGYDFGGCSCNCWVGYWLVGCGWWVIGVRLVHVFKNWKFLFENTNEKTPLVFFFFLQRWCLAVWVCWVEMKKSWVYWLVCLREEREEDEERERNIKKELKKYLNKVVKNINILMLGVL